MVKIFQDLNLKVGGWNANKLKLIRVEWLELKLEALHRVQERVRKLKGNFFPKVCGIFDFQKPSVCIPLSTTLPMNTFTRVQIQQRPNGDRSKFIVTYNETTQWVGNPKNPRALRYVRAYIRDPTKRAAKVETKNYKFYSGTFSIIF